MLKENEIEILKKYLGEDGKLIISDDLTEKQKERFLFINSLNIDLISVLTRKTKMMDIGDEDSEQFLDDDNDTSDLEVLSSEAEVTIEEDDNAIIEGFDDFF